MNKRSRRHHVVPKVLLKNFADERGRIWYSKKDSAGWGDPAYVTPDGSFWRRDYSTVHEGGVLSDIVERNFYGPMDDFIGQLCQEIIPVVRAGRVPKLGLQAVQSIREIIIPFVFRSPDFIEQHVDDEELGLKILQEVLALARNDSGIPKSDIDELLANIELPHRLRAVGRDARVRAQIEPSDEIVSAMEEFSVRWAVPESRSLFIIGSALVYRIGNGGSNGISSPTSEMWFPVAEDLALVLVRDPSGAIPQIVTVNSTDVRGMNEYCMKHSSMVGSSSKALLRSLIRNRG